MIAEPLVVLVVDDDELNRMVVEKAIDSLGCTVHVRADGYAALDAVRATDYDLLLIDVRMPGINGVETSRSIRALAGSIHQPTIVALTAFADSETAAAVRGAGIDELIEKPVQPDQLRALCDRILRERARESDRRDLASH